MSNLIPCKHLDHNPENYPSCELKTCELIPHVKFFERKPIHEGAATQVQFCGQGRGRINSIFDCYESCSMSCYEPTTQN
jgi:hypothetical protein